MAKKKAAPKRKVAARKPAKKKTPAKRKTRRKRSRGKSRNKRTKSLNATTAVEQASGISGQPDNPVLANEPPESFHSGPSVELLDGSDTVSREMQVIREMMAHEKWVIPEIAFENIPKQLTAIALNIGVDPDTGEQTAGTGTWTPAQQLKAIDKLEKLHGANFRKLAALKPQDVRLLDDKPTTFTTEDQRFAALAAVVAEIDRRQSGGAIPD